MGLVVLSKKSFTSLLFTRYLPLSLNSASPQRIPNSASATLLLQMPTRHKIPKMLLQSIPDSLIHIHLISHRHSPIDARKIVDLQLHLDLDGRQIHIKTLNYTYPLPVD